METTTNQDNENTKKFGDIDNNIIVFDIDGLLCWQEGVELFRLEDLQTNHPECALVSFGTFDEEYTYCFIPYLDVLFKYLVSNNCRIVFFSAGHKDRNDKLIEDLLIKLLGKEEYNELVAVGQFEIFSANHMRPANDKEFYVNYVKDLNIILKENESILNSILIEDQYVYAAYDQKPCIMGIKLDDLINIPKDINFSKNATYYLIGIFIEYFHSNLDRIKENNNAESIREWFNNFLSSKINPYYNTLSYNKEFYYIPDRNDQWVINLINNGYQLVRQKYPNSILYGITNSLIFNEITDGGIDPDDDVYISDHNSEIEINDCNINFNNKEILNLSF